MRFQRFKITALGRNLIFELRNSRPRGIGFPLCIFILQEVPKRFALNLFVAQRLPACGSIGFGLQPSDLFSTHGLKVSSAFEIFPCRFEEILRFAAALFIERHAGGLFQINAQFFGLGANEARNHALRNDGVAACAQPRAHKDFLNIAAAHLLVIDVIGRYAFLGDHAAYGQFFVLPPRPFHLMVRVVKHQFDACSSERRTAGRARENQFAHRTRTSQFADAAFAQHPANRINDVRFAAAVRAHDRNQRVPQFDHYGVREAFEAGDFDLTKVQRRLRRNKERRGSLEEPAARILARVAPLVSLSLRQSA